MCNLPALGSQSRRPRKEEKRGPASRQRLSRSSKYPPAPAGGGDPNPRGPPETHHVHDLQKAEREVDGERLRVVGHGPLQGVVVLDQLLVQLPLELALQRHFGVHRVGVRAAQSRPGMGMSPGLRAPRALRAPCAPRARTGGSGAPQGCAPGASQPPQKPRSGDPPEPRNPGARYRGAATRPAPATRLPASWACCSPRHPAAPRAPTAVLSARPAPPGPAAPLRLPRAPTKRPRT